MAAVVISIVDDDPSIRVATDTLVRSLGYLAYTFASAEEFLRSPQADNSDCLIADIQMPGMSGLELQKALLARGRRIPVIFITAFPDANVESQAMKGGAVGFFSKPFDAVALTERIAAALAPKGSA